jgi:NADH dehydrogenase/NADH:ubiquinone oxidoreductase subunit G
MGALTSKDSSFELRDWDVENFESLDPTDNFGTKTSIFVKDGEVIQIEPCYDTFTYRTWLTDRGRQFFDSVFKIKKKNKHKINWFNIFKTIVLTVYLSEYSTFYKTKNNKKFFTTVFENTGLNLLSYLKIVSESHSFLKIRKSENNLLNNDLESYFQLNSTVNDAIQLERSTLCLLIGVNPRYEGYYLNLNLKKRKSKGNFKSLIIGSKINTTYNSLFLGSTIKVLKSISAGNNLTCKELKTFKKPIIVFNTEFYKHTDRQVLVEFIKIFKFSNALNKIWLGVNILTNSLAENGINSLGKFKAVTQKDLTNYNLLYFINVGPNSLSFLKKAVELKLINFLKEKHFDKKQLFCQNSQQNIDFLSFLQQEVTENVSHILLKTFYENEETYVNTEGLFCSSVQAIPENSTKSAWQIIRKIFSNLKKNTPFTCNKKDNIIQNFEFKNLNNFRNYINLIFYANNTLINLKFHLQKKTQPFLFTASTNKFKSKIVKTLNYKLHYWMNSFFTGSKDEYSLNSLNLNKCDNNAKVLDGTFF